MPAVLRVRQACTECHTRGLFTPVELMLRQGGAWHWQRKILCAVCRLHLVELTGFAAAVARRPGPRAAAQTPSKGAPGRPDRRSEPTRSRGAGRPSEPLRGLA